MILIADCGSTKCDWAVLNQHGESKLFETQGFNPYFHDEKNISGFISSNRDLIKNSKNIREIYFYGAGCSQEKLNLIVEKALKSIFTSASIIVRHDLYGAAFATWNQEPAITGILGTGSNSCFFDGKKITQANEGLGLGYILGDEGSGSYYGKILLRAHLQNTLPGIIHQFLEEHFNLSRDEIVQHVYRSSQANVYLASFTPVLIKFRNHPWTQNLIQEGMTAYLNSHVRCYENHLVVPLHMIGSIAFIFKKELRNVAKTYGISLGNVIQKPITGLIDYHSKSSSASQ